MSVDPGPRELTAEPMGGAVWHASRGAITMRVDVRGREAHVGQVYLGDSAFDKMISIARPLIEFADRLLEKRTSLSCDHEAARRPMLVIGRYAGSGPLVHAVPGRA